MGMSILTEVKALLEITDTTFDAILTTIIADILAKADEYMDIKYSSITDNVQYFDGGIATVYLAYTNISNLVFEVDDEELTEGRTEDYVLYPDEGKVKCSTEDGFVEGLRIITATYDGGYAEDDLPVSLRGALIKQIAYNFRRRKDPGLSSVTFPDGTIQKHSIDEWLKDVKKELDRRKRIIL
jgi:hypothetical protein